MRQVLLTFLKGFSVDIYILYAGKIEATHTFLSELNNLHPSIKFTMSQTSPANTHHPGSDCEPKVFIPFPDTSCQIIDGKIVTDLFRKETDRNQYLLPSSCHPAHVTENIPFSLALRIVRICSFPTDREK